MRKQHNQDISSFDLLLDTMCNTFGGIIFIAILMAVLSRAASNAKPVFQKEDIEQAQLREIEQRVEMEKLSTQISNLNVIAHRYTSEEKMIEQNEVDSNLSQKELVKTNSLLQTQLAHMEGRLNTLEKDELKRRDELHELEKQVEQLQDRQTELEAARNHIEQQARRTLRMPRLHQVTDKRTVFFAIRNKKFYAIHDVSEAFPAIRGYDTSEVLVESGPSVDIVELKPDSGQLIVPGTEKGGKLRQALDHLNQQKEYVNIAVYSDSYAEFNYIKNLFVQRGFEYNWKPVNTTIQIVRTSHVEAQ